MPVPVFFIKLQKRTFKLQKMPALKSEHLAIQKLKIFIPFPYFLRAIFPFLEVGTGSNEVQLNPDRIQILGTLIRKARSDYHTYSPYFILLSPIPMTAVIIL
jgi:hypothetical protein